MSVANTLAEFGSKSLAQGGFDGPMHVHGAPASPKWVMKLVGLRAFSFSYLRGKPMRHSETLPAWAARQRSRRLGRHSDDKVVRWINQGNAAKDDAVRDNGGSSNDNVVAFNQVRSVPAR
ncbi:hypothetical protein HCU64_04410 [Methylobacterium sp. C25]|uniref:hypothetical protein n=1 Tax=Methylobacterium sp. C25 TaxID=2721622 RepID=UPI001F486A0C|nr:hypothetical protein [Methylobacterium sp. C25]MCE4222984.1 hypothetical protein [Methylobacterium sp. C25]